MEKTERMLAKLLGETYRLQHAVGVPVPVSEATVYGLLNGIPEAIRGAFDLRDAPITDEQHRGVIDVLNPIWEDLERRAAFRGFYGIEDDLQRVGVDRGTAAVILTYLNANRQFRELIAKMDSDHSPMECRDFKIDEWSGFPKLED